MIDHTPISKVSRLDVISTGARRRWTLDEKQRIVAESYSAPRLASLRRDGTDSTVAIAVAGRIEIVLPCGCRVVVDNGIDAAALASILAVLEQR